MRWRYFCVIFTFSCYARASSKDVARINDKAPMVVDNLITRIRDDNWSQEEAPCLETTLALLTNVKNLTFWATWVWESNQYPVGNMYGSTHQLGNYDQCMNPPWLSSDPHLRTQYCMAEVKMVGDVPQKGRNVWDPYDSTEEYINTATRSGFYLNTLHWGVCVPASCSPRSVGKLLRHMYQGSQYAPVAAAPHIAVDHCQLAGEGYQYPLGFYMFIAMIVLLLGAAIVSTVYQSRVDTNDEHPAAFVKIISKAFCMKRNYNQLMKVNPEEIHVMNGIRFLTACIIVYLHHLFYLLQGPIINPLNMEKDLESMTSVLVVHGDIMVDTFLAISGLLHVRYLMSRSKKNLLSVLWKRYLRLLGPLAISIFYVIYVAKYTGSGPFWPKAQSEEPDICTKTWRLSLMMLNTDFEEVCHAVTWYLACDYQLTILGTVLFYFYQRDKKLGYTAFGVAAALSFIIPGVFVYWYRLPVLPCSDLRPLMNFRHEMSFKYNYTRSYVRAGAYLVGVAMSYFMTVFKPADHRRTVSMKWSLIGTTGCVVTMLAVISFGKFSLAREYSGFESIMVSSLNRAVWALAVCCIIALCEYGDVPIISDLLGLPAFVPLSRLCYGIYLIHPFVIQRNLFSTRSPLKYDQFSLLTDTLGTVCMSACISFCLFLLIEAPYNYLVSTLFINKSQHPTSLPEELKKDVVSKEVKKNDASRPSDMHAAWDKTKIS